MILFDREAHWWTLGVEVRAKLVKACTSAHRSNLSNWNTCQNSRFEARSMNVVDLCAMEPRLRSGTAHRMGISLCLGRQGKSSVRPHSWVPHLTGSKSCLSRGFRGGDNVPPQWSASSNPSKRLCIFVWSTPSPRCTRKHI